ncbi:MAG: peptidoglycan DD-metalloendopeptidase family protein [Kiloniellales bacterium]|nr:peptidoglycan DD-metalloendopeptidase family protein [Kiloniellales bacterium]
MNRINKRTIKRFLDRLFIEREIFLRANDRVRYIRLSRRSQELVAIACLAVFGWLAFTSTSFVFLDGIVGGKDKEIERHRLAYFDLLSEVSEYHDQFVQITRDLEGNQAYLLSLLEQDPSDPSSVAEIKDRLEQSQTERARVVVAQEGLRERLESFENDLKEIASRNASLHDQVSNMRSVLRDTQAERAQVVAARAKLGARLTEVETELAEVTESRDGLKRELGALGEALTESRQAHDTLESERAALQTKVSSVTSALAASKKREEALAGSLDGLDSQLDDAVSRGDRLESERDDYAARVAVLSSELEAAAREGEELKRNAQRLDAALGEAQARNRQLVSERDGHAEQLAAKTDEVAESKAYATSLNENIRQLEAALADAQARNSGLAEEKDSFATQVADLGDGLERANQDNGLLNERIAGLQSALDENLARREQLARERDFYETRVAGLEHELKQSREHGSALDGTIAEVRDELAELAARGERVEQQRDFYEQRVTHLEQRLDGMRDTHQAVIDRVSSRTRISIDTIEKTIAMTGLEVSDLLSQVQVGGLDLGQGGPFIPNDFISETDPSYDLQASVALLDMQMDRWEALQKVVQHMPLVAPLDHYRVTSNFGPRRDPINGRKAIHKGLDLGAPSRTPVLSTAPGEIVFAGWRGRYGRMVEIDHGFGIKTRYGHLRKILVKPGQQVGHRDKIGLLGSSGRSTGPHVHYEVLVNGKQIDPTNFLKAGRYVFKG